MGMPNFLLDMMMLLKFPYPLPFNNLLREKIGAHLWRQLSHLRFLVPDLTVGQFVHVIRKRINLPSEKAIFIFVNNVLPSTGALMGQIDEKQKDEDGFLYVTYSGENTF